MTKALVIDTPESLLSEALKYDELARIERSAGNYGGAARLFGDSKYFLNEAARLELELSQ